MRERLRRFFEDQRVRFLLVGGINTGFGFAVFIVFDLTVGRALDNVGSSVAGSIVTLLLSHVVASILAFVLYRRFVFRVTGNVVLDFVRFQGVYAVPLAINLIVLPVLVEVGVPRIAAQATIIVVTTLFSYFGHKFFSFRRRNGGEQIDPLTQVFQHDAPTGVQEEESR